MRGRVPLWAALALAAVASLLVGVAYVLIPILRFQHPGDGQSFLSLIPGVLAMGAPVAAIATAALGWPSHRWLAVRGGEPWVYLGAGAAGGLVADVVTVTVVSLGVSSTQGSAMADVGPFVMMMAFQMALPAVLAGAAAAGTVWGLRRPDIWRTP